MRRSLKLQPFAADDFARASPALTSPRRPGGGFWNLWEGGESSEVDESKGKGNMTFSNFSFFSLGLFFGLVGSLFFKSRPTAGSSRKTEVRLSRLLQQVRPGGSGGTAKHG